MNLAGVGLRIVEENKNGTKKKVKSHLTLIRAQGLIKHELGVPRDSRRAASQTPPVMTLYGQSRLGQSLN